MKRLVCGLFAVLCMCPGIAIAQECGGSGSNGMTNCRRGDGPLVPKPFNPRPAGPDTTGPGRAAPASGPPPVNHNGPRTTPPPGTIAK
jgi:hypothetical protein